MENEFKNPCIDCICFPICVAKSKNWKSEMYSARFHALTECEKLFHIWIKRPLNEYVIMVEFWRNLNV